MGDFTPQIATTASTALLVIVLGAVFRLLLLQRRRDQEYEKQLNIERHLTGEARADAEWCGRDRSALITLCQRKGHGDEIPEFVWTPRPRVPLPQELQREPG